MRLPTRVASRPNLFAEDVLNCFFDFGFLIIFLLLGSLPVSMSMSEKSWLTPFSSCTMAAFVVDECPVCVFIFKFVN